MKVTHSILFSFYSDIANEETEEAAKHMEGLIDDLA
jgi:hypothetical protein